MIANMAQEIGDYLAQEVHPENGEEKLLKQMWEVSTEEEQQNSRQHNGETGRPNPLDLRVRPSVTRRAFFVVDSVN